MKCPFCEGTGKCYQQTITYEEVETNRTNKYLTKCFKCNGTGEIEQTNEEWFCGLSTEEKAKVLRRKTHGNDEKNERIEQGWVNWLKAKHEDNPPDIPSVPSWDNWLQGEKSKCEFCDGNGVECDLYGRSECPKTPKTEQEYIQTCTTEQLAEWIANEINERVKLALHNSELNDGDVDADYYMEDADDWSEWLKQPHNAKE